MEITEDDKLVAEEEDNTDLERDNKANVKWNIAKMNTYQLLKKRVQKLFNQEDLNDLIRNLGLSKNSSKYLAAELKR